MTNSEIYREWKQAKDPKAQVGIIADMEFRSKKKPVAAAIMEQCELNSETVPLYIKRIAGTDITEDLKTLIDAGMTVKEIADGFDVLTSAVNMWMRKAGLRTHGALKNSGADDPGQVWTDPDAEKALASASPLMTEMAAVIAECAAKLGKGELIISAYPDGSCSIMWKLEAGNEKA